MTAAKVTEMTICRRRARLFVRYQREDEGRDLKRLFEQRPDITVYGPDVSSEDWLAMVRKQLLH